MNAYEGKAPAERCQGWLQQLTEETTPGLQEQRVIEFSSPILTTVGRSGILKLASARRT